MDSDPVSADVSLEGNHHGILFLLDTGSALAYLSFDVFFLSFFFSLILVGL